MTSNKFPIPNFYVHRVPHVLSARLQRCIYFHGSFTDYIFGAALPPNLLQIVCLHKTSRNILQHAGMLT